MTSDSQIQNSIDQLVQEEHRLWDAESRGEAGDAERQRLAEIKVELDRCWDLLRQRRAKEEFGMDPDVVAPRDESVVENYEQ
jgi:Protein of unknown function (DUF2630)